MDIDFFLVLTIIIVLLYIAHRSSQLRAQKVREQPAPEEEPVPEEESAQTDESAPEEESAPTDELAPEEESAPDSIDMNHIPLTRINTGANISEPPTIRVNADDAMPSVALSLDAAIVNRHLGHDRAEQRAKLAANALSSRDFATIWEEEFAACEARDWWDNIRYPVGPIEMFGHPIGERGISYV